MDYRGEKLKKPSSSKFLSDFFFKLRKAEANPTIAHHLCHPLPPLSLIAGWGHWRQRALSRAASLQATMRIKRALCTLDTKGALASLVNSPPYRRDLKRAIL